MPGADAGDALVVREIPRLLQPALRVTTRSSKSPDFFAVHYSTVSRVLNRARAMTERKT